MSNKPALILGCGLAAALFSFNAGAFPVLSPPAITVAPIVTPVRNLCAAGYHQGASGHCVPDTTPGVYGPEMYAGAPEAAPAACPAGYFHLFPYRGCIRSACPSGYYLGRDGQCFPYWQPGM
jgi:hypothetical protein